MITMDMLGKVRRMKMRDKLTISQIAKRTGLARNTIKRWLKAPGDVSPRYLRQSETTKLGAYEETLIMALKADAHRHKDGRRTARALFGQITALGYRGGYSAVTDFVRAWRSDSGKAPKAFVPLVFENGEAFQFDWSEEGMLVGGVFHKVQAAHLKLCASRAFWLVAYPTQSHEMLFDAHTLSFTALGGVPHRGIYDNMKTAVDEVHKGKGRVVNARFKAMCSHYLFDPDFCNLASGWEKGRVEKNVQDSRRRIWIEARERRFGSFVELNVWLAERCRAIWAETAHPDHPQFTIAEMLEIEREHLMAMPAAFDGYVERSSRVSSTCLVTVARNRYSVPCEWAGKSVSTRLYPTRLMVVVEDMVVARHDRLTNKGQTAYDWQHYIALVERKPGALRNGAPFLDMPAELLQLRRSLMRYPGGDRVVADVLAAVPRCGIDAVLVAVAIALEDVTPSGQVSVEHIENVLARLRSPPTPELAQTDLQLLEAPRADTARYDQLRGIEQQTVEVIHGR
jgi:transposase